MSATPNAREVRTTVNAALEAIEKLSKEIESYKNLPVVHGDLQTKVRALAKILVFLQLNAYGEQSENATEEERLILERDILNLSNTTVG